MRNQLSTADLVALAGDLPGVLLRDRGDWTSVSYQGRGFAWVDHARDVAMVKSTHDDRAAMVATAPDVYAEGWASASTAWVLVQVPLADPDEVAEILLDAWRMTAPRRVVAGYDGPAPAR